MNNIDFSNIRPVNGSMNDGFEEFVCQLARKEEIDGAVRFVRNGKPDGGVEGYWILQDGSMAAWQVKYFLKSFDSPQFQQIDDSVKTAFSNYSGIKKYVIAIPIDIPDCHKPNTKSMKQRMDDYVQRWKGLYPDAEFEIWGQSELILRAQKPENQGMLRFWLDSSIFTTKDFINQNKAAISDLGVRYTPENNVRLELWRYFHAISRDDVFEDFFNNALKSVEQVCNTLEKDKHCKSLLKTIEECRTSLKSLRSIDLQGVDAVPVNDINEFLYDFSDKICDVANSLVEGKEHNSADYRAHDCIYKENVKILNVYNAFNDDCFRLVNDPVLVLEGEAGVGKSHLFADVVSSLSEQGRCNFLFLGQKFTTDDDAISQLLRMANFKGSFEDFLDTLECQAQTQKHRIVIFIDAINEGQGINIWPLCLRSLIEAIRRHKWIGLALSLRSSYCEALFPKDEYTYDFCVKAYHYGFGTKFMEAIKLYFHNYSIALPQVPLLSPELHNPLFLRLFCEGLRKNGYTALPEGFYGFTSILKLFLVGVEKSMREKKRYSPTLNVVQKAINKFITYVVKNKRHEMPLETAIEEMGTIYPNTFGDGELIEMLISEGVFVKNVPYDGSRIEVVYLSYERIENTLIAQHLLEIYEPKDLKAFLLSDDLRIRQMGLFEALAVLLPEESGIELKDLFVDVEDSWMIFSAMMKSILWRKKSTLTEELALYFEQMLGEDRFHSLFLEILLQVSFIPQHKFNGHYLHKHLMSMKLPDRDALWIPFLRKQYEKSNNYLKDLVHWAWEESNTIEITNDSILPGAIAMSWLLASTNRELRDKATKGLVSLLTNRLHIIVPLLECFEQVDDPYVLERLYAVSFGCITRANDRENTKKICCYIYKQIFDTDGEAYPHVLLRDYAREAIEYAISIGVDLQIDEQKIRPPYRSSFEYEIVPDKEIKDLLDSFDGKHNKSFGLCHVITSMCTEHSRIFSYGDFGRYTFQSALLHWSISPEVLCNIAVKMIIEKYGYDETKHGVFDTNIGSGRTRNTQPNERIGKKYQWLAMHELMARVSDNFPMIEHPWSDKETTYYGPWEPFVRDIDPTTLSRNLDYNEFSQPCYDFWWSQPKYNNWDIGINEWLAETNDIVGGEQLIQATDCNGEEWLVLEQWPAWAEPHETNDVYKRYWNHVRSYIVDDSDFDKLYDILSQKETNRNSLPECRDLYQMFYREFYWSPAYEFLDTEYDNESINHHVININEQDSVEVNTTSICYLWEAETDHSKSSSVRWLIPSKQLFDGMKLQFSDEDGVFMDWKKNVVLFDGAAIKACPTCLLVKKAPLQEFLRTNNKRVFWNVTGEKNIIGSHYYGNIPSWLYMSGCYKLNPDGSVTGCMKTSRER